MDFFLLFFLVWALKIFGSDFAKGSSFLGFREKHKKRTAGILPFPPFLPVSTK